MFEDNVRVDLSGVPYGKLNYANVPFLGLFSRPCIDRLKVMDEGPDYAIALLSEFCSRARCLPVLAPSGVVAVKVQSREEGRFRPNISYSSFSSIFSSSFSSPFYLFIFFFLSPLPFLLCFFGN